jgi:hypothetical protein
MRPGPPPGAPDASAGQAARTAARPRPVRPAASGRTPPRPARLPSEIRPSAALPLTVLPSAALPSEVLPSEVPRRSPAAGTPAAEASVAEASAAGVSAATAPAGWGRMRRDYGRRERAAGTWSASSPLRAGLLHSAARRRWTPAGCGPPPDHGLVVLSPLGPGRQFALGRREWQHGEGPTTQGERDGRG